MEVNLRATNSKSGFETLASAMRPPLPIHLPKTVLQREPTVRLYRQPAVLYTQDLYH